jgi:hypothetical protein
LKRRRSAALRVVVGGRLDRLDFGRRLRRHLLDRARRERQFFAQV